MRFLLCTRPYLAELLRALRGHQSVRRGITMNLAILVGGTGPTESIAAVAGRVAHLWRATTRVHVPLPVSRGGCARRDKIKRSERVRRVVSNFVEVLGLVSLVLSLNEFAFVLMPPYQDHDWALTGTHLCGQVCKTLIDRRLVLGPDMSSQC
jgi:hypothetical protein